MSRNCKIEIGINLLLVSFKKVESNVIRVSLYGVCEEVDDEWRLRDLDVLERESEPSRQNEYLHDLLWLGESFMKFQKV